MSTSKAGLTYKQHPQEVCASSSERTFFQRLAVLDEEEHVKYKVKPCSNTKSPSTEQHKLCYLTHQSLTGINLT